jgi:hypothetical protein
MQDVEDLSIRIITTIEVTRARSDNVCNDIKTLCRRGKNFSLHLDEIKIMLEDLNSTVSKCIDVCHAKGNL